MMDKRASAKERRLHPNRGQQKKTAKGGETPERVNEENRGRVIRSPERDAGVQIDDTCRP